MCDKCGYTGDLSNMPSDPKDYSISREEAIELLQEGYGKSVEMFEKIGWKRQKNGDDWCPKCVAEHVETPQGHK